MARKVLVLLGHPRTQSLCGGLAEAYVEGAAGAGAEVRLIKLEDLAFNPTMPAYDSPGALEPDLLALQQGLLWAEHVALVYPTWWGGAPGRFKAALERVLLPGVAFKYHDKGSGWDRLLTGRSGELIVTMDTPPLIYQLLFGSAGDRVMAKRTLDFCGIKPVAVTHLGPVRSSTDVRRATWLARARKLGARAAR